MVSIGKKNILQKNAFNMKASPRLCRLTNLMLVSYTELSFYHDKIYVKNLSNLKEAFYSVKNNKIMCFTFLVTTFRV